MLEARIRHARPGFTLDATLSAAGGRMTVLLGENGAGKTTLLRALAGLTRPDEGSALLMGSVLFDIATSQWSMPEARPVGMFSPSLPLFAHLDVRANLEFGLLSRTPSHREVRIHQALERFQLQPFAGRSVATLSTGERQRVALARVMVREPSLLLLDEPFSALDTAARLAFRALVRATVQAHAGVTLLVSHDPTDALALADDVIVLERGRITQAGSLERVLRAPASPYIARFLGVNLFEGVIVGPPVEGTVPVRLLAPEGAESALIHIPDPKSIGKVRLVLHPREVMLSRDVPHGSARNHLKGRVLEIAPEPPNGDTLRVTIASTPPVTAQITRASVQELALAPGVEVIATFKATAPEVTPEA